MTRVQERPVLYRLGRIPVYEEAGSLDTPCHVWGGSTNIGKRLPTGYPRRRENKREMLLHREVYEKAHGPLKAGEQVHHLCERTECINPAHLEALTLLEHRAKHRTFDYEEAVELRTLGMTYAQIGRELGVTGGAVRRAFERMKERGEL